MWDDIKDIIYGIGGGFAVAILLVAIVISLCWYSSSRERRLYNVKFETNYTTADFFWTGETIKNYIQQGEQKTHNIKL